jgi:hypothetical protein
MRGKYQRDCASPISRVPANMRSSMGDKSPKSNQKQKTQKQAKSNSVSQKKQQQAAAKVEKPKK